MPRRIKSKRPKQRSTFHKILDDLDEESASEEDFDSVSTDNQATNYNLEYTGQSLKPTRTAKDSQAAATSPTIATPIKSALKRSSTSFQEGASISERLRNRSEEQSTTSRVQTRASPSKNTSRVRFSLVDDEGSEPEEEQTSRQPTRLAYDAGQKRKNKNVNIDQPGTSGKQNQSERRTRLSPSKSASQRRSSTADGDDSESEEQASAGQSTRQADDTDQRRSTRNVTDDQSSTSRQQSQPQRRSRKQNRPQKHKPSNVLKEIRRLQQAVDLLIPKLSFARIIRETLMQHSDMGMRITLVALEAIQEATELYLVQLFEDSYRCTKHRNRVTLTVKDMELVRFLRGPSDPGNFT